MKNQLFYKVCSAILIVMLALAALPVTPAKAAISQQQVWSTVYANNGAPGTNTYTINPGSNRMLVVAVSSSRSTVGTQTATVTYGGQSLTQAIGDGATSAQQHTWLFYLQEAGIAAATNTNLSVTVTGGTIRYNYVYAAVYAGVDQSASPLTDIQNFNGAETASSTVGPFATGLTINSGDQAVEIVNLTRTGNQTARTITTWATNWTAALGPNSGLYNAPGGGSQPEDRAFSAYIATNNTAGSTTSQHTASGSALRSMSAMSIKAAILPIYTITATAGVGGTITPAGAVAVEQGSNQSFVIAPSAGHIVSDVLVNGVSQGRLNAYTFTNVTTNHTIEASFESGWSAPSAFSDPDNDVGTQGNVYTSNNGYATINSSNDEVNYQNFGLSIPSGATINGIEVAIEGYSEGTRNADIALSSNNGVSITAFETTVMPSTTAASEATVILGGPTDDWGRAWTSTDFANGLFAVRVEGTGGGGTDLFIDQLQVKVHYTTTVTPTLSITNSPVTYNGSSQAANVTCSSGGAVSNILYNGSSTVPTNAGTYAVTANCAAVPGFSALTGASAGNFVIDPANATINVTPYNVTYNGSPHTSTGTATGVLGEDLSAGFDLSNTTHTNVGTYNGDTWSFNGGTNYNNANGTVDNVISPANATIVVNPYNVTYDGSPHTSTGTATGVLGEDLSAGLDLSGTTHTNASTYNGDAWSFNGGTNYNNANGTVDNVISPANATIVVNPYNVTYDGSPHTSTGTATGVLGEDLSAGLNLSGTTHTNAGTYNNDPWTFTDLSGNYVNTNGTVNNAINAASATITLSDLNHTYDGTAKSATVVTNPLGLSFSITYDGSPTAPTNADNYAVVATITDPNYSGTANDTLVIAPATVTPSITANNKVYDGNTTASFTCSLTGIIGTDDVTCSDTANFDNKNVGTDKTVTATGITLGGADATNYTLSTNSATDLADITARDLNVTATGINKVYDGNTNATVTLNDDRVGGDDLTLDYTSASFASPNVGNGILVSVSGINISSGADAGNYNLVNNSTTTNADITPAGQTITVTTSAPASAANGSSFDVAATASSGLPVTITVSGVCSIGDVDGSTTDGDATITMTSGTGTCSVFYDQAGNTNYSAAPQVQEDVNATESPVFTSVDNTSFDFGFSDTFLVMTTGNPSSVAITMSGEPAGVTLIDNGNGTAALNYDGTTSPGVYTITFFGANGVLPNGTQTFTLTIRNGPAVSTVNSLPDTGNGSVSENENISTTLGITQIMVEFDRDVYDAGASDPDSVTNPANYLLVRSATGTFSTASCSGGLVAPDVQISVDSVTYDNGGGSGPFVATLNVNSGLPLNVAGFYRLFVCGTTSIVDAGNPLLALAGNGVTPGTDFTRNFRIAAPVTGGGGGGSSSTTTTTALTGLLIPVTGFAPSQMTELPAQPIEKEYAKSELTLKIPSLGVNLPIVGVKLDENGWDVTWLGNNAGYLEGSAYPTWNGNSILTSHVTDPNGKPGPFAYVNELRDGDKVYIHNDGFIYVYEVRESSLISPRSIKTLFKSEEDAWLTLVTCENFNEKTNTFTHRRVIRAVLISVIPEK